MKFLNSNSIIKGSGKPLRTGHTQDPATPNPIPLSSRADFKEFWLGITLGALGSWKGLEHGTQGLAAKMLCVEAPRVVITRPAWSTATAVAWSELLWTSKYGLHEIVFGASQKVIGEGCKGQACRMSTWFDQELQLPAPPNYPVRDRKYHLVETIRPLIEAYTLGV